MDKKLILQAKDVVVKFDLRGRVLTAIRGACLDVYEGETLAIVGEAGSGKSVFSKTFNGLNDKNCFVEKGEILYKGRDLAKFRKEKDWMQIRGKEISMVLQEPMTSLNPLKTIGDQICEAVTTRSPRLSKREARQETLQYLADVGIPDVERRYKQYPHEFSGGMPESGDSHGHCLQAPDPDL